MKKIIILLIFILLFPFTVLASEISLYSDKYLVYDITNEEIILSKDITEKSAIASLTKIMTTITAIENTSAYDSIVTINPDTFANLPWDASVAGLKIGDQVTIKDLLYASILPSGADATQALAIKVSGSVSEFVKLMNKTANKIGMNNSHFMNVTGLDTSNHYSTLEDLLKLLKYALSNELFSQIYKTKEYKLSNDLQVQATIKRYNTIGNKDILRILGSKTGFTDDAGLCMSAIFKSNGHDYLLITLGAQNIKGNAYNLLDSLNIISYVDANYDNQIIFQKGDIIKEIEIKYAKENLYKITVPQDVYYFTKKDYKEHIRMVYEGAYSISVFQNKKTKLGTVKYYYDDILLSEESLYLNATLHLDILSLINAYKIIIIVIIVGLISIFYLKRRKKRV